MTAITQKTAIYSLLKRFEGEWVALPKIMHANNGHIAQYNARIFELRRELWPEHEIECRREKVGGETHTWYRLQKVKAQEELKF
jgi:hypothetical protein